ncbi:MAG: Fe2+-dependent dioxygenase [Pseudomonadota bacterium]
MVLVISNILDAETAKSFREKAGKLKWRDGRITAGATAKSAKRNEQANLSNGPGRAFRDALAEIVSSHPVLNAAARPRRFSNLMVSRTADNGHYGPHVDNAIMGKDGARFRTDLSFTLFLTPPETYEGGELIIHTSGAAQSLKEEAGSLILYPTSEIHEVAPVTRGVRMACVGWIESLIADTAQRDLLFDLENLRASMRERSSEQSAELLTLDKTIANLLRMWATP